MAESNINFTEGSGKRIHTWDRTISSTLVQDQFVLPGEFPYPTYRVFSGAVAISTADSHLLQVMAGASLRVRARRIRVWLTASTTSTSLHSLQLWRLSTAGSGGTAKTPAKFDTADAAAAAAGMTLPTTKGTESVQFDQWTVLVVQTPAAGQNTLVLEQEFGLNLPPLIIPAGTSNGIAVKNVGTQAAGSLSVAIDFVETAF